MKSSYALALTMALVAAGCGVLGCGSGPPDHALAPLHDLLDGETSPDDEDRASAVDEILRVRGAEYISFLHLIGMDPCPQRVATLTLENLSGEDQIWSAFSPAEVIDIVPDFGLLEPTRSVTITVQFNCSRAAPVSTFVEILVEDDDGPIVIERIPVEGRV